MKFEGKNARGENKTVSGKKPQCEGASGRIGRPVGSRRCGGFRILKEA